MAINNFVPTIWSALLTDLLEQEYLGIAHCSRDYEGEIRQCGDTVRICGLNPLTVGDYTKNTDIGAPQELSPNMRDLKINQAKYFNFLIDDIDRAQSNPDLMERAMKTASIALKNAAEQYVFEVCKTTPYSFSKDVTVDNIMDIVISARTTFYSKGISSNEELFLEITPQIAKLLFKAKMLTQTDNTEMLQSGLIGTLCGCKVYVSSALPQEILDDNKTLHHCFMRTKQAVTFAEQLSEIDAYRPENRFADAVKGLHLYGAKIVNSEQILRLDLTLASEEEL